MREKEELRMDSCAKSRSWLPLHSVLDVHLGVEAHSIAVIQLLNPWLVAHWFRRVAFGFVAVPTYAIQRVSFLSVSVELLVDIMIDNHFRHIFYLFRDRPSYLLFHPACQWEDDFRCFRPRGVYLIFPSIITSFGIAAGEIP